MWLIYRGWWWAVRRLVCDSAAVFPFGPEIPRWEEETAAVLDPFGSSHKERQNLAK